eukprot:11667-Amphidinium_carterae.3
MDSYRTKAMINGMASLHFLDAEMRPIVYAGDQLSNVHTLQCSAAHATKSRTKAIQHALGLCLGTARGTAASLVSANGAGEKVSLRHAGGLFPTYILVAFVSQRSWKQPWVEAAC